MFQFLANLVASNSKHARQKRRSPQRVQLTLDALESRTVPSASPFVVLDFDGDSISAAEMSEGGWSGQGDMNFNGFNSLFANSSNPLLDLNKDSLVNLTDASLFRDKILAKVRQDFAPYKVNIFAGDQDSYQGFFTFANTGSVMVMITGTDTMIGSGNFGIAPSVDVGNDCDDIVWAWGQRILDAATSTDQFINRMARTISHEVGHAFGLEHVVIDANNDAMTHFMMGKNANNAANETRDYNHDFGFQDISYMTVGGFEQNSHQYLTDTLGASTDIWTAVLKPGELTVHGSDGANNIKVSQSHNAWVVDYRSKSFIIAASNPDINSLNPFDAPLTGMWIYGKGGHDTIEVSQSMTAWSYINGGSGRDTLKGGGGMDVIVGGDGNDTIYGFGGADVLVGGNGYDKIYGGAGNDYLDGGHDGVNDYLRGGSGADTFYVNHHEWDNTDLDTLEGDLLKYPGSVF